MWARAEAENRGCYPCIQQGHHRNLRKSWRGGKQCGVARNTALSFGREAIALRLSLSSNFWVIFSRCCYSLYSHWEQPMWITLAQRLGSHRVSSIVTLLVILTVKQPNKWIIHAVPTSPFFPCLERSNFGANHKKKKFIFCSSLWNLINWSPFITFL